MLSETDLVELFEKVYEREWDRATDIDETARNWSADKHATLMAVREVVAAVRADQVRLPPGWAVRRDARGRNNITVTTPTTWTVLYPAGNSSPTDTIAFVLAEALLRVSGNQRQSIGDI